MKGIKVNLIAVIVVFAVIAVVAPISAVDMGNHTIEFTSYDFDGTNSTWCYNVTSGTKPAISNWVLAWCNPNAILGIYENGSLITNYEYAVAETHTGITGIKFENDYADGETRLVCIELQGDFDTIEVEVGLKASGDVYNGSYISGPKPLCGDPSIPEFSTIAIPVAMILGLLFFFNHRKKRGE
ncbi:hypothetical protein C5S35_01475 [Candidatus Methanophagaceae archaeon]|nr:hypothetical protein C5S35_01475 [Methanophagales archaeon]